MRLSGTNNLSTELSMTTRRMILSGTNNLSTGLSMTTRRMILSGTNNLSTELSMITRRMILSGTNNLSIEISISREYPENFEDPKVVIRSRTPEKVKQYNGKIKRDKRRNTYLQNTTPKTKD
jgi:hypothetical protein